MQIYLLFFIQVFVIVKSTRHSEYFDQEDVINEDLQSDSISNEVVAEYNNTEVQTAVSVVNTMTTTASVVKNNEHKVKKYVVKYGNSYLDLRYHQTTPKKEEHNSTTTLINYPFAVSIQRKWSHYATGALIDKKWILSSAGEFYNVRESIKLFRARLGSVDCKRGGTVIPLKKIEIHPSYVYGLPNFDLCLLKMAHPVEYTNFIKPIRLSKIRTKVISAKFMTTYWPRIIVKGALLPPTAKERIKQNSLRVSTQRLIPRNNCFLKMYGLIRNTSLHDSTMCLRPFVTHHSLCLPDAGAPIVAEDGLWGITSGWISEDCLTNVSPTVFTRISSLVVRAWLDSHMVLSIKLR